MLFNSFSFFALLVPAVALYWAVSRQCVRLGILFAASMIFYSAYHWPSAFLLLGTIGFNYAAGRLQRAGNARVVMAAAVTANLSLLLWFKYSAFIADNVNAALALFGANLAVPRPPVFLPLGISFFTFQVVAYQVDVFRREVEPETSLARFAVFKCFFPQLIAGPIVRAKDFLPQLREPRRFDPAMFHQGLWLLLAGMALKIGVADVLAQFADEAFNKPAALSTVGAWTGLYAYAFQLFADFWGYSTMAVGLAALFGLALPLNFNLPYAAKSIQEFWRRWHITLSIWFRDYLYIPLGGNRRRRDLNLLLTMAVAGVWHGAGWTFVLWGIGHGLWMVVERRFPAIPGNWEGKLGRAAKMIFIFHGVCLLWVLFRAPTLEIAGEYYRHLMIPPFTSSKVPGTLAGWLIVFALIQKPVTWSFEGTRFTQLRMPLQWLLAIIAGYFVLSYAGARIDFIYFTF